MPLTGGGIKGLAPLIAKEAPKAIEEVSLADLQGRRIAIDASMALYQFIIAIRASGRGGYAQNLASDSGDVTSHLMGFFWRTIALARQGIRMLYVFDGKPPKLKSEELACRSQKRAEAETKLAEAKEREDVEEADKLAKRTLKITSKHINETKRLLTYMGIPHITAPAEAEAQCAYLAKKGVVDYTATEDMDALCTGTPVLIRKLASSSDPKRKNMIRMDLKKVLEGMNLTMAQFVDVCILCGCDYCPTIRGIGPKTALAGIRKHGSIENYIATLDTKTRPLPERFPYAEARGLMISPDVLPAEEVRPQVKGWYKPVDSEGLTQFLVKEKGFSAKRVASGISSLKKAKVVLPQASLLDFFKVEEKGDDEENRANKRQKT
mmetsp:Transcript_34075/g.82531  ORF Transcript_34075/g.82531 Transcript_34075/m.82531 type:complete len:379 (-) Transcript_34075:194-1330(-)